MADSPTPHRGWLPPVPPGGPGAPSPASENPPAGAPVFVRPQRRAVPKSAVATASLTLGVVGLVLLTLSLGLGLLLSLPCSAAAWALATLERRRAAILDPGAEPPASAGRILGILGVVLALVALVLWGLIFASGASPEDILEQWRQELERQQQRSAQALA